MDKRLRTMICEQVLQLSNEKTNYCIKKAKKLNNSHKNINKWSLGICNKIPLDTQHPNIKIKKTGNVNVHDDMNQKKVFFWYFFLAEFGVSPCWPG